MTPDEQIVAAGAAAGAGVALLLILIGTLISRRSQRDSRTSLRRAIERTAGRDDEATNWIDIITSGVGKHRRTGKAWKVKRFLAALVTVGAILAAPASAAAATSAALPACRVEAITWATSTYWGGPGPTYRLTQTDCVYPRPKSCLKLEIVKPVLAVLYEPSCSPATA